ncbi:MAG: VanW family protein [Patescibacteria group bacterium]
MVKQVLIAVIVILFFIIIINLPFLGKIYPNIYIANLYVGDKDKTSAINLISNTSIPSKITLNIKGVEKEILSSEIVKKIDYEKSVNRAYTYTHTGNFVLDFYTKIKLIFKPLKAGLEIEFDQVKLEELLLILSSKEGSVPISPSVKIINSEAIVDSGKNGVQIDIDDISTKIKSSIIFLDNNKIDINLIETKDELSKDQVIVYKSKVEKIINKKLELKLDFDTIEINDKQLALFFDSRNDFNETQIKLKIADVSRKINRNPQNSVFIIENGNVTEFTPSQDGITVDEDKLVEEIKNYVIKLSNEDQKTFTFNIPVIKSAAKIKNEDVNDLGINTLLGKGVSYFKGSIQNRIYNINLAQSKFKGVLVPPNEIFSFNEVLGDVSSYTGYKAAYVIMEGKTVLGDGGGVCQVSTTLFRAVLSAGLPIMERRAHAYRVGYYEQGSSVGLDATVYSPTTDFKFKNDTANYLLIQPTIDNNNYSLIFEIYGTSDGRVATTTKPIISSQIAPADDLYIDDPTLPLGNVKQTEHKAWGAKVSFNYHVERDGQVLIDQKFSSNYRPWQAVYLRGSGQ